MALKKNTKPLLIIDYDGTICQDRYWRSLPEDLHATVQSYLFGKDKTLVNDWMRGKHTAKHINQLVAKEIDVSPEWLWEIFVMDCKTMKVSLKTLKKISSLRDRFIVILMTGNMDSFTDFTVPSLELEKYFDCISNSYHEKRHKTDDNGILFSEYAHRYGPSSLEASYLIDDSSDVCRVFSSLGGTAFQVTQDCSVDECLDFFA
jgi:hypothetical protein